MQVLVLTVGAQLRALPLTEVVEVMRAQPITSRGMLPQGVLGTAVIVSQPSVRPMWLAALPYPEVTQACSIRRS